MYCSFSFVIMLGSQFSILYVFFCIFFNRILFSNSSSTSSGLLATSSGSDDTLKKGLWPFSCGFINFTTRALTMYCSNRGVKTRYILMSLIQTCKILEIDFITYARFALNEHLYGREVSGVHEYASSISDEKEKMAA